MAVSEDLKEYDGEVAKAREELKDRSKVWLAISSEAEVTLEAQKLQQCDLRQSFKKDAAAWTSLKRKRIP